MVVRSENSAISWPSKPMIEISSGTFKPFLRIACSAPSAISSDWQNIAVGRSALANKSSIALLAPCIVKSPKTSRDGLNSKPLSAKTCINPFRRSCGTLNPNGSSGRPERRAIFLWPKLTKCCVAVLAPATSSIATLEHWA